MRKLAKIMGGAATLAAVLPSIALAQDAPTLESLAANDAFVFNTLLFLIGGFLVMFAGLMFWIVGYNLMYGGSPNFFGAWDFTGYEFTPEDAETGYSSYSDWFFQMVFCATTASIVSGTVAERIKFWPFIIFTAVLTGIIYPIVGSWEWGGGYLDSKWAFSD